MTSTARDQDPTTAPGHAEFEYINPGSLENRASTGLKVVAAVNGFGVLLAIIPPNPPVSTLSTVTFNAASAALVAIMVLVAIGIGRERPWAVAAIRPLFAVIALGGIGILVLTLLDGRIRLPIDVAVAAWVLLGRPDTRPMPRLERRSTTVFAASAALAVVMVVAGRLLAWGGALDVQPADLRFAFTSDCSARPAGGGVPEFVEVDVDWSWSTWRPFPSGIDVVVLGWDGDDATGRPLYFIGQIADPDDGIHPGLRAYPSAAMAAEVLKESRGHWPFGIRLDEQGYEPGHIDLQLYRPIEAPPSPEPLRLTATYIHEGAWRVDAAPITCNF